MKHKVVGASLKTSGISLMEYAMFSLLAFLFLETRLGLLEGMITHVLSVPH